MDTKLLVSASPHVRSEETTQQTEPELLGKPVNDKAPQPSTCLLYTSILLSKAAAQPAQVNPCIRCGRCVEYCPMGLEPVEVNQAYAARDVQAVSYTHLGEQLHRPRHLCLL